jgi:hypothetical protein
MWFLQRRNTHNQIVVLALLIALVHIAFLVCLFFVYHDVEQHLEFRIMPNMMPREIEFRVAVERVAAKKGGSDKSGAKAVTQPPAKKMPPKSTQIASPKKSAKKAAPAKKSAPAKAAAKKVEEKKAASVPVAEKKEPEKVQEKIEEKKIEPVAQASETAPTAAGQPELDHINFDLSQKGFPAMFEAEYQALYENLSDQWAPPAGVPVTSQCVITVVVDKQGEVEDMLVDNSSGMMVFDLAARSALSEVEFPRFVWGKSITVTFSV